MTCKVCHQAFAAIEKTAKNATTGDDWKYALATVLAGSAFIGMLSFAVYKKNS